MVRRDVEARMASMVVRGQRTIRSRARPLERAGGPLETLLDDCDSYLASGIGGSQKNGSQISLNFRLGICASAIGFRTIPPSLSLSLSCRQKIHGQLYHLTCLISLLPASLSLIADLKRRRLSCANLDNPLQEGGLVPTPRAPRMVICT